MDGRLTNFLHTAIMKNILLGNTCKGQGAIGQAAWDQIGHGAAHVHVNGHHFVSPKRKPGAKPAKNGYIRKPLTGARNTVTDMSPVMIIPTNVIIDILAIQFSYKWSVF